MIAVEKIMSHPFWWNLSFETAGHNVPHPFPMLGKKLREQFLTLVLAGFYPISASSPLAFRHVAEYSKDKREAEKAAMAILEVEEGKHPFVEWYGGISHAESFHRFLSSLAGTELPIGKAQVENYLTELDFKKDKGIRALAAISVIENAAPKMVCAFQDLAAQWQTWFRVPSSQVWWPWLAEHTLTEGAASADQHITLVGKIMKEHAYVARGTEFTEEQNRYADITRRHLDQVWKLMQELKK